MFDTRWDNWAGDFGDSFAASLLDPQAREFATDILRHFGEAARAIDPGFPDVNSPSTFARVMAESMPRVNLPAPVRSRIPEVVASFLEYLQDSGRLADGAEWAERIRPLPPVPATAKGRPPRPPAGEKGVTIRKPAGTSTVGRNEPCPCGSGKKYKKCCLARE